MLTPERLFRLMIELIFVLLGLLVVWLGLVRHVSVDRRGAAWLILSVALIVWGLRALYSPGQWWLRWRCHAFHSCGSVPCWQPAEHCWYCGG
jgi:hypothetical protein